MTEKVGDKPRPYALALNRHCEERSGWERKAARDDKEERNARFIFAGFDTGANIVLNDVIGS